MTFQDALFNWLQIRLVSDARPEDGAARETLSFFEEVLREDHGLTSFNVDVMDETMVHVRYEIEGKSKKQMFDRESVVRLLADIESNPKYNE